MILRGAKLHQIGKHRSAARQSAVAVAAVLAWLQASPAHAQQPVLAPTSPTVACADVGQDFVMPPEFISSGGVLQGTINLTEEQQRLPTSTNAGTPTCAPQWVRVFRGEGLAPTPAAQPASTSFRDPMPGPTLRARLGDLVQLTFVNQVNSNRFDRNIDLEACTEVGQGGSLYPLQAFDAVPNCLHASSTANIHFHGTHTNPNSTGDNVYLQVRPLPRDNQGALTTTPAQASVSLDEFFRNCAEKLQNPLNEWPTTWGDMPRPWVAKQAELLQAYQTANPTQQLWTEDLKVLQAGGWPQYYIGVVPYCFALPRYTAAVWPPPPGSTSPNMGQAPGTHWYHAHKHGSTAINVANGMTGVLIIEGEYDDDLNHAYGGFILKNGQNWNTRAQPTMVLNQLGTTPNLLTAVHSGAGPAGIDFTINGRVRPTVQMQPGEIQLWRIANTAGRNAAYFMAPEGGLQWRQLAQDGVQFANANYQNSLNQPIYIAPGNRVDLLVKAPLSETSTSILIQPVMGRSQVKPTPASPNPTTDPKPGVSLMSVKVSGPQVMRRVQGNLQPAEMQFLQQAPRQPKFLQDIGVDELARNNYTTQKLIFGSKPPGTAEQHTINGIQFQNGQALVSVPLGAVQEWKIVNTTNGVTGPGTIDHPFHIHINPFQIPEMFDPNEKLVDPETGQLERVLVNNKTQAVPRYVTSAGDFSTNEAFKKRQCLLDIRDESTWKPCGPATASSNLVWWDVFAIPSARVPVNANNQPIAGPDGKPIVIPGYFRMRSRFVDYPGLYVLHCHILVHEDRGMMFSVQVGKPTVSLVKHH